MPIADNKRPKIDADEFMRMMEGLPPKRKTEVQIPPVTRAEDHERTMATEVDVNNSPKEVRNHKKHNTPSSYEDKYLRPIEKNEEEQNTRICICIPDRLHATLKRLCNLVFDGKVSMTAFVTNVLNDHIENHRELYNSIYQPKSWNE